jgi:hypothetical protein
MRTISLIVIMAGILNGLTGCKNQTGKGDFQDDKFNVGQIWNYNTRPGEENSTLTILKVEKYDSLGIVIHIYVSGLKLKNNQKPGGYTDDIGHLPLSKEAVLKSVTHLVSEHNKLPDFQEGYTTWKTAFNSNKAGIFSIDVSEVVKYVEEVMNTGTMNR